jgi:hypothetical protein
MRGLPIPGGKMEDTDNLFQLLHRELESNGNKETTEAMEIPEVGCVVKVTTLKRNMDSSYSIATAVTFVPGVEIMPSKIEAARVIERRLIASNRTKELANVLAMQLQCLEAETTFLKKISDNTLK